MTAGLSRRERDLLGEFFEKLASRLEQGRKEYGASYLELTKEGVMGEIEEELLDVAGWALVFWLKLKHDKVL